ncbi:hypothetical protein J7E88_17830 [Streptomyces sp. ISL-10]|uniref:hypothetical protein n=1 Tax=Streptomyces sp. ISL-10 TaxID=2819172 RepID=UPI001BECA89D|nr:hypothetical protein [Streptomyces sp. ISL-10]MBT2367116.1 hypothetical protein [Streptomyces sp. ISL-10]
MAQEDDELTRARGELARDLVILRIENGNPSLRVIERHAPAGRSLSASAVSEVLNGKRLPGLDFLMALVQTLIAHGNGGRPVPRRDPRLDAWRARWRDLQLLQSTGRSRAPDRRRPATAEPAVEAARIPDGLSRPTIRPSIPSPLL